jgi:cell pole-organizing protein PopZ
MSVAASTDESVEAEALRRAQRAHEPSMEEILASIRAIIADDREPAPAKTGPQIVYSSDTPAFSRPFPEPLSAEPAPVAPTVVRLRDAVVESQAVAEPSPRVSVEPVPDVSAAEPLLSEESESAVSASFLSLSESMAAHGMEVAEGIAREMLRPMLKAWLDENLPAMVERLVRAEIQRVARGRR